MEQQHRVSHRKKFITNLRASIHVVEVLFLKGDSGRAVSLSVCMYSNSTSKICQLRELV